jgi:hypothetical protein
MNEDDVPNGDDLMRMTNREEFVWEIWYRIFMYKAMRAEDDFVNAEMYHEYFRKRANRTPEDWYGTPDE